jgi:hypothetical protein
MVKYSTRAGLPSGAPKNQNAYVAGKANLMTLLRRMPVALGR